MDLHERLGAQTSGRTRLSQPEATGDETSSIVDDLLPYPSSMYKAHSAQRKALAHLWAGKYKIAALSDSSDAWAARSSSGARSHVVSGQTAPRTRLRPERAPWS